VALLAAAAWSASSDEPSLKVTYQGEKELTNARKIQRNAALKADALANRRLALNRELSLIIGAPLPAWADTVPASNMSYSFQDYLRLERDPRRSCRFECKIFGETCGLCKNDCPELLEQIGPRLVAREDADVVILSPELSRKTSHAGAVAALVALPRRPPGSFYLLHKRSHGLAPLENCGLAWPNGAVVPAMPLSSFCALLFRPDVIFADVDLGEHDLDDDDIGSRLRGITLPTGGAQRHTQFTGYSLAASLLATLTKSSGKRCTSAQGGRTTSAFSAIRSHDSALRPLSCCGSAAGATTASCPSATTSPIRARRRRSSALRPTTATSHVRGQSVYFLAHSHWRGSRCTSVNPMLWSRCTAQARPQPCVQRIVLRRPPD